MNSRTLASVLTCVLFPLLTGCFSSKYRARQDVLRAAPDPPELAQLDSMLGTWDGVAQSIVVATGETFDARSVRRVQWEAGGQFLSERTVTTVAGAQPTTSLCIWGWDELAKVFRSWRFDSHGSIHERTMSWDEERQLWLLDMTTRTRGEAEPSTARGALQYISEDEKVYEWTRYKAGSDEAWIVITGKSKRISKDA